MADQVPDGFQAGSQIAGYRLEERIGQGGMAVVFRAYDNRLDRQVALKILAPSLAADQAFRQRFIRESRAAAAVDDAHIIPVYEAGEANGVLFIAMRYVRGGDVRSLIDRIGPVPAARAAEIISQVASALDSAHGRGLVHRDVKPGNMLLEESSSLGRPEHVYLSDFGLSKAALAAGSSLTASGQFLGTLDYVAPEQIESRPLDGRSDEYALACSAFELLSGEPPFGRGLGVALMYAHLSQEPPLLSSQRPGTPAAVDEVLTKGMAKAPEDRYATCREFAAALEQALSGPGTQQAPAHPRTEIASAAAAAAVEGAREPAPEAAAGFAAADRGRSGGAPPGGPPTEAAASPAGGRGRTEGFGGREPVRDAATGVPVAVPARRPWWRSPLPIAALVVVVAAAAVGGYLLSGAGKGTTAAGNSATGGGPLTAVAGVRLPGCTTAVANAKTLKHVTTATTTVAGSPFGAAVTGDNRYTFVSTGNAVAMLRNGSGLAPSLVRTIAAPGANKDVELTPDGRYVVAAAGSGAVVINVQAAISGAANPVTGSLISPGGSGAVEVLITTNGKYAFVTLQNSAEMAVFNLKAGLAHGFSQADFIGDVPLADQPVGIASDGTWLYVVSLAGKLAVIDQSKAESDPAHSVVVTTNAGCGSARAVLADHDKVLWVTARQSNALLAFDTAKLRSDPRHALLASVRVGEYPLGEVLVNGGTRMVIADSDLNNAPGQVPSLAVVSTSDALQGKPALLGYLPAGQVPRQFALEPSGTTLLATLQGAQQVLAVDVRGLP